MSQWVFPSNNYGQINGIADSGVETFKGTPIKSLAREICQNSLDAHLDNDEPTKISFSTFQIKTATIPDIIGLKDAFVKSLSFWSNQQSEKARKFFESALNVSNQPTVTCLRISDHNTTGLTGSNAEYNTPWCNLTKSSGTSDKSGTNGGSFGIGKFAPFACSSFRTVFYSTLAFNCEEAYQGVARLTSFKKDNGEITQGIGYFGDIKNSPIFSQCSVDPNYSRTGDDSGTDIYIFAFNGDAKWKNDMVASILDGFLYAVYCGRLIVDVEGILICKESLPNLIEQFRDSFTENADKYYSVLTADETKANLYEGDIKGLGKVILKMMIQPDLHRRCAMVRKTGMKIMDRGYISSIIPFAAILYIEGDNLNSYLRSLENPQHTKWEIDRADDKSRAREIDKAIMSFIKSSLEAMKKDDEAETIDPSLGNYLAFEDEKGKQNPNNMKEDVSDKIKNVEVRTVTHFQRNTVINQDDEGKAEVNDNEGDVTSSGLPCKGSGHTDGQSGSGGRGNGNNDGNDGDNNADSKKKLAAVASAKERIVCVDKNNGEYRIVFTPSVSATDGHIELFQSAETQNYEAVILAASCEGNEVAFINNAIAGVNFVAKKPVRLTVQIDYHDYCALEVKAYGHKV